ncbi:VanZ family protein [Streptomyces sp. VRA16 Mangrove soil]|uniref:VanZ family protein n=1 Tax=Streptomyces sp. VRA16 Mangrove soil TaxID=2817434 RepID=UPI001A9F53C7|nr:VanZ family protein [Streptomyces sp. VRA16 Mangrove soil]
MTSATTQRSEQRTARWWRVAVRAVMALVAFVALVAFSAVLARLTLTPSPASDGIAGANLRPGASLRQYAESYTFLAACKQIGGNLLLGAPFGLFMPVLVARRRRMLRVLLVTALVMVLVEMAQGALVEGRAFDVDDVLLNTAGALIAYVLVGRRIGHRYHALAGPREERRLKIRFRGNGPRDRSWTRMMQRVDSERK